MSLRSMQWAVHEAPVTDNTQKVILITMGDYARPDGTGCWLSQASLAKTADCSDRTIRTHLKLLEEAGVIRRGDQSIIPNHIPAHRRPVVYDLCLDRRKSVEDEVSPDVEPDESDTSKAGRIFLGRKSGVAMAGNSASNDRKLASAKSLLLREELRPVGSGPSSLSTLAALRAAERAACDHGAMPGRCALCRARAERRERGQREQPGRSVRSHRDDIRMALSGAAPQPTVRQDSLTAGKPAHEKHDHTE